MTPIQRSFSVDIKNLGAKEPWKPESDWSTAWSGMPAGNPTRPLIGPASHGVVFNDQQPWLDVFIPSHLLKCRISWVIRLAFQDIPFPSNMIGVVCLIARCLAIGMQCLKKSSVTVINKPPYFFNKNSSSPLPFKNTKSSIQSSVIVTLSWSTDLETSSFKDVLNTVLKIKLTGLQIQYLEMS